MPPNNITIKEAMGMNRAARRKLGKINGVKIPSIENLPKRKIDIKKEDKFFNSLFNKK